MSWHATTLRLRRRFVHRSGPLAKLLELPADTLERANEFLSARPAEVAAIEASESKLDAVDERTSKFASPKKHGHRRGSSVAMKAAASLASGRRTSRYNINNAP